MTHDFDRQFAALQAGRAILDRLVRFRQAQRHYNATPASKA